MVRYGIINLESCRATDDRATRYFFGDLRNADKQSLLEMGMLLNLHRHIPPHGQKQQGGIRYSELDTPRALTALRPNLGDISATIHPEQELANWANEHRQIASAKDRPIVPYMAPKLTDHPRIPSTAEQDASRANWISYTKQSRRTAAPKNLAFSAARCISSDPCLLRTVVKLPNRTGD